MMAATRRERPAHLMTLEYDCPHCQCPMSIGRDAAGQEVVCPACRVILTLPTPLRMTKREARSILFPTACRLLIEGGVYLLFWGGAMGVWVFGCTQVGVKDVLKDLIVPLGVLLFGLIPGVFLVVAARAVFRAESHALAVGGVIVSTLLGMLCCFFCFFVGGLGMWFQYPILNDPLLREAMDRPE